jgi:hypothetical protein
MGKVWQFLKIETRVLGYLMQVAAIPYQRLYPCRSK